MQTVLITTMQVAVVIVSVLQMVTATGYFGNQQFWRCVRLPTRPYFAPSEYASFSKYQSYPRINGQFGVQKRVVAHDKLRMFLKGSALVNNPKESRSTSLPISLNRKGKETNKETRISQDPIPSEISPYFPNAETGFVYLEGSLLAQPSRIVNAQVDGFHDTLSSNSKDITEKDLSKETPHSKTPIHSEISPYSTSGEKPPDHVEGALLTQPLNEQVEGIHVALSSKRLDINDKKVNTEVHHSKAKINSNTLAYSPPGEKRHGRSEDTLLALPLNEQTDGLDDAMPSNSLDVNSQKLNTDLPHSKVPIHSKTPAYSTPGENQHEDLKGALVTQPRNVQAEGFANEVSSNSLYEKDKILNTDISLSKTSILSEISPHSKTGEKQHERFTESSTNTKMNAQAEVHPKNSHAAPSPNNLNTNGKETSKDLTLFKDKVLSEISPNLSRDEAGSGHLKGPLFTPRHSAAKVQSKSHPYSTTGEKRSGHFEKAILSQPTKVDAQTEGSHDTLSKKSLSKLNDKTSNKQITLSKGPSSSFSKVLEKQSGHLDKSVLNQRMAAQTEMYFKDSHVAPSPNSRHTKGSGTAKAMANSKAQFSSDIPPESMSGKMEFTRIHTRVERLHDTLSSSNLDINGKNLNKQEPFTRPQTPPKSVSYSSAGEKQPGHLEESQNDVYVRDVHNAPTPSRMDTRSKETSEKVLLPSIQISSEVSPSSKTDNTASGHSIRYLLTQRINAQHDGSKHAISLNSVQIKDKVLNKDMQPSNALTGEKRLRHLEEWSNNQRMDAQTEVAVKDTHAAPSLNSLDRKSKEISKETALSTAKISSNILPQSTTGKTGSGHFQSTPRINILADGLHGALSSNSLDINGKILKKPAQLSTEASPYDILRFTLTGEKQPENLENSLIKQKRTASQNEVNVKDGHDSSTPSSLDRRSNEMNKQVPLPSVPISSEMSPSSTKDNTASGHSIRHLLTQRINAQYDGSHNVPSVNSLHAKGKGLIQKLPRSNTLSPSEILPDSTSQEKQAGHFEESSINQRMAAETKVYFKDSHVAPLPNSLARKNKIISKKTAHSTPKTHSNILPQSTTEKTGLGHLKNVQSTPRINVQAEGFHGALSSNNLDINDKNLEKPAPLSSDSSPYDILRYTLTGEMQPEHLEKSTHKHKTSVSQNEVYVKDAHAATIPSSLDRKNKETGKQVPLHTIPMLSEMSPSSTEDNTASGHLLTQRIKSQHDGSHDALSSKNLYTTDKGLNSEMPHSNALVPSKIPPDSKTGEKQAGNFEEPSINKKITSLTEVNFKDSHLKSLPKSLERKGRGTSKETSHSKAQIPSKNLFHFTTGKTGSGQLKGSQLPPRIHVQVEEFNDALSSNNLGIDSKNLNKRLPLSKAPSSLPILPYSKTGEKQSGYLEESPLNQRMNAQATEHFKDTHNSTSPNSLDRLIQMPHSKAAIHSGITHYITTGETRSGHFKGSILTQQINTQENEGHHDALLLNNLDTNDKDFNKQMPLAKVKTTSMIFPSSLKGEKQAGHLEESLLNHKQNAKAEVYFKDTHAAPSPNSLDKRSKQIRKQTPLPKTPIPSEISAYPTTDEKQSSHLEGSLITPQMEAQSEKFFDTVSSNGLNMRGKELKKKMGHSNTMLSSVPESLLNDRINTHTKVYARDTHSTPLSSGAHRKVKETSKVMRAPNPSEIPPHSTTGETVSGHLEHSLLTQHINTQADGLHNAMSSKNLDVNGKNLKQTGTNF